MAVGIGPVHPDDVGELLTLQRAAFVTEAQLYDDPRLPALVETLPELLAAVQREPALTARDDGRLVGAVRARVADGVLHVGRLVVAPDQQGRGIGRVLLAAVERAAGPDVATAALSTGHRSAANLRLYARAGYVEQRRERVDDVLTVVHLAKPLR
ncbi:GNAT family N-acetyltransferase [Modestobacter sp. VKM Ac-2986]|uniref:GNAT family N-acetyltransferase n=1 Tax=Modestobacter sp. VKM Ac-2986 TaxID=3004140 RepID=UPI0022AB646B|nr:GNAT family N-acetyltransferase [Modestobacter sp. VKM Ac-2986]MCZ2831009.1 GNAT family N-acetyltransferase [Modestobacter sp. VKM Ac-2986]